MLVTVPVYTSYCILEVQYIPRLFTFIDDTLSIYCKPFLLFWKSCYIMPLSIFLARYQQEFDGDLSTELAERFYHQAIYLNPDLGWSNLYFF